jgi:hypothetical protein
MEDSRNNLYEEEKITIIAPLNANSNIFNKEKFDVKIINTEDEKLVIIREK